MWELNLRFERDLEVQFSNSTISCHVAKSWEMNLIFTWFLCDVDVVYVCTSDSNDKKHTMPMDIGTEAFPHMHPITIGASTCSLRDTLY